MTTREKLLQVTFDEIYYNSYGATSIDKILKKAGMNKGSVYHLFKSKHELILAVINENLMEYIEKKYTPLLDVEKNIIDSMMELIKQRDNFDFIHGCKLNNFVQELSSKDKEYQKALERVYLRFEKIIALVLHKAVERKEIKENINIKDIAIFIVASIEGCLGTAKKSQDPKIFSDCINQLEIFLKNFRLD